MKTLDIKQRVTEYYVNFYNVDGSVTSSDTLHCTYDDACMYASKQMDEDNNIINYEVCPVHIRKL